MGDNSSKHRKDERKTEAKERQVTVAKMTPEDRIKELNRRLGKGMGAEKERRKLKVLIEKSFIEKEEKKKKKENRNSKGKKKKGM